MRKETVMNITEREIDDPEKGGVILEYVNFTKEFAEIKEYVRSLKGIYRDTRKEIMCFHKNRRYFIFRGSAKQGVCFIRQISFMKLKADCISWKRK